MLLRPQFGLPAYRCMPASPSVLSRYSFIFCNYNWIPHHNNRRCNAYVFSLSLFLSFSLFLFIFPLLRLLHCCQGEAGNDAARATRSITTNISQNLGCAASQ